MSDITEGFSRSRVHPETGDWLVDWFLLWFPGNQTDCRYSSSVSKSRNVSGRPQCHQGKQTTKADRFPWKLNRSWMLPGGLWSPVERGTEPSPPHLWLWWVNYDYLCGQVQRGPLTRPGSAALPSCQLKPAIRCANAVLAPGKHLNSL